MLQRRPHMRTRLFTDDELKSLAGQVDDAASLAARFAVREATMKALALVLVLLIFMMSRYKRIHQGRRC